MLLAAKNLICEILGRMKITGHIDPDMFDVFMRQRIYETYAAHVLPPEQRGEVDVAAMPGYARPPLI